MAMERTFGLSMPVGPCVAYCLDLMLEDIRNTKTLWIQSTVHKTSQHSLQHDKFVNLMKTHTNERKLLCPGITKFAAKYILYVDPYQKTKLVLKVILVRRLA